MFSFARRIATRLERTLTESGRRYLPVGINGSTRSTGPQVHGFYGARCMHVILLCPGQEPNILALHQSPPYTVRDPPTSTESTPRIVSPDQHCINPWHASQVTIRRSTADRLLTSRLGGETGHDVAAASRTAQTKFASQGHGERLQGGQVARLPATSAW